MQFICRWQNNRIQLFYLIGNFLWISSVFSNNSVKVAYLTFVDTTFIIQNNLNNKLTFDRKSVGDMMLFLQHMILPGSHNIVLKHPVDLIYHLFHTIYFHLQCNLLSSLLLLTTCFGCTWPSSGVSNSLKLLHCMACPTFHISCECDTS
jgi:hypothetical protein